MSGDNPYRHDALIARYPAGTDPRRAVRDAVGEFMVRADGTTDMPWWLEANVEWYHAGIGGLKPGDTLFPPTLTGVVPILDSDPSSVYVTTDRSEAMLYLTFAFGRFSHRPIPSLYVVSFPEEPISDDTQPDSTTSWRVRSATVRAIASVTQNEIEAAMREIAAADSE